MNEQKTNLIQTLKAAQARANETMALVASARKERAGARILQKQAPAPTSATPVKQSATDRSEKPTESNQPAQTRGAIPIQDRYKDKKKGH
jgi:hypothetical protein